ncbi:hypothetical protein P872_17110 [Rhodonellum psychrophilum GCM71 = DSM 17998]|uniref:Uncharacterized protein n=1 Tax=Rhodonellum psychrophilum GCM71 = DSM 17998 TaxID=1123057 RepID=U5BI80_9BACT|nr:hypothetical protein P872_17110 [Rhodonellum psychrophilum GCM71 = DSM 17998]
MTLFEIYSFWQWLKLRIGKQLKVTQITFLRKKNGESQGN